MNVAVGAALTACLVFAAAGPYLAWVLPPSAAVRLLVPAALLSASCAVFVLATVAFTLIGQLAEVAEYGRWSAHALHVLDPVPAPAAVAACGLLAAAAGWTLRNVWRTGRALMAAQRLCREMDADPAGSHVVVVDDPRPDAFTTPNLRARIVVTTGMLAALDPPGRRVLLAHEQSHRAHRHTWWVLAAELAAAVDPLLRPTARAVRDATERWADEDAARVTDRRLVAATIAQVALLGARPTPATAAAAATGGRVPRRVAALLHTPPRLRPWQLFVLIAVTTAVLLGALAVERTGEKLFEHARRPAATVTFRSVPIR
jgi:Zn-dependent protease with chaperone function